MSFQEKSAWVMSIALIGGGGVCLLAIFSAWSKSGQLLSPGLPLIVVFTVFLILVAIIGHIIAAVSAPDEANAPLDEREEQIMVRAGHYSAYVLGAGVVLSLGHYLVLGSGDLLFYTVLSSLVLSQLVEYLIQIFYFRTSV